MAQKRERDLNNDNEPACKRRKKNNKTTKKKQQEPWENSDIFKKNKNNNTVDKKQYNKIFNSINDNVDVPLVIVKEISDFCVGNSLKCWNKNCSQRLSFLQCEKLNMYGVGKRLKCKECYFKQYFSVCKICFADCTRLDCCYKIYCNNIKVCRRTPLCHDHLGNCKKCGVWWCSECWDLKANEMLCSKCIN